MKDTRFFFFDLKATHVGDLKFWDPSAFDDANFLKEQGEGWQPVDHTILPKTDGTFLLSIMAVRKIDGPDITVDLLGDFP